MWEMKHRRVETRAACGKSWLAAVIRLRRERASKRGERPRKKSDQNYHPPDEDVEEVRAAQGPGGHVLRQGVAGFFVPAREQRLPVHERQQKRGEKHLCTRTHHIIRTENTQTPKHTHAHTHTHSHTHTHAREHTMHRFIPRTR